MHFTIYLIAVASLLGFCSRLGTDRFERLADKTVEYQLESGQYAVIVVIDGISTSEAKIMARQRAAEITVQKGDRYFTVDSEQETRVIQSEDIPNNRRFYGNMYQELIIEHDFGKDRIQNQDIPNSRIFPAIRLVFTTYPTNPGYPAIDACSLTNCPHS